MKKKLSYSIYHCRAIDADFDRTGANEEEAVHPGENEDAAAAALSEDSDRVPRPAFGAEHNDYSSEGIAYDEAMVEEE